MQKKFSYILLITVLLAGVWACGGGEQSVAPPPPKKVDKSLPIAVADSVQLKNKGADMIRILKAADWKTLAEYVHPEEGLRISPHADVNVNNVILEFEDLQNIDEAKLYDWGYYDGSGSPIRMNLSDYHKKFMFDLDFTNADKVIYNKFAQYGNTRNTIPKMYPEGRCVEYYFSGKGSEFEGFNWRALRLIFTQFNDEWYLTAVIHSQWTI